MWIMAGFIHKIFTVGKFGLGGGRACTMYAKGPRFQSLIFTVKGFQITRLGKNSV